jgi:hypothetical protein
MSDGMKALVLRFSCSNEKIGKRPVVYRYFAGRTINTF